MKCPGLAIFLIQEKENLSIIGIPYELLPMPEKNQVVDLLDKEGRVISRGRVQNVTVNNKGKTHIVFLEVPKGLESTVRSFQFVKESEEFVCRCEEITRKDIEQVIDMGVTDYEELRRLLRIGMGPCGGKTCRTLTLQILSQKTGMNISDIQLGAYRPPTMPIPFEAIANAGNNSKDDLSSEVGKNE
jgi:bacterioferritin-associated ferredoxin